jgi:hypothetical protein
VVKNRSKKAASRLSKRKKEKGPQETRMTRRGSVYCIANGAMPGIVKIGATLRVLTQPGRPLERGALRDVGSVEFRPHRSRCRGRRLRDGGRAPCDACAPPRGSRVEARREFFELTHSEARALRYRRASLGGPAQGVRPARPARPVSPSPKR